MSDVCQLTKSDVGFTPFCQKWAKYGKKTGKKLPKFGLKNGLKRDFFTTIATWERHEKTSTQAWLTEPGSGIGSCTDTGNSTGTSTSTFYWY